MGEGGRITLVNGTIYDWNRTFQHSYQMDSWDFPKVIKAGTSPSVYVEWDQSIIHNHQDDAGEVTYTLNGTGLSFQVQARGREHFHIQVQFTDLAIPGNPRGSITNLGWEHDGWVHFTLAGKEGHFISANQQPSWMHDNLPILGGKQLRQLCMPGSHDAGMSTLGSHTAFATECNTLTQSRNILEQLQCGVRYFDIRPVITAGKFATGHYGHVEQVVSYQGGNGEWISDIIDEVNKFTATNKELVILNLSHTLNTDVGFNSYTEFTQQEWDRLLSMMKSGLNDLFVYPCPESRPPLRLDDLYLDQFIGDNRAAVVVTVDDYVSLGELELQGFYSRPNNFYVYDDYANTNDVGEMIDYQFGKMREKRTSPKDPMFLLSWTMTQKGTQPAFCNAPGPLRTKSILDLAREAYPQLYRYLLDNCTPQCYPNIIYIDDIRSSEIAALAMAVNMKVGVTQQEAVLDAAGRKDPLMNR